MEQLFNVAYWNWYDEVIQFTEIEAKSGLDAMKQVAGISSLDVTEEEEEYFKEVEKRGGFVAYETKE